MVSNDTGSVSLRHLQPVAEALSVGSVMPRDPWSSLLNLARVLLLQQPARPREAAGYLIQALAENPPQQGARAEVHLLLATSQFEAGLQFEALMSAVQAMFERPSLADTLLWVVHSCFEYDQAAHLHALYPPKRWKTLTSRSTLQDGTGPSREGLRDLGLFACRLHAYVGEHALALADYSRAKAICPEGLQEACERMLAPHLFAGSPACEGLDFLRLCRHWAPTWVQERIPDLLQGAGALDKGRLKALDARVCRQIGSPAWQSFQDAAEFYVMAGHCRAAVALVQQALVEDPPEGNRAGMYWYLMEAQRVLAHVDDPASDSVRYGPYVARGRVAASLRAWEQGVAYVSPAADPYGGTWAYHARGLLWELQGRLGPPADVGPLWEAAASTLWAVLLNWNNESPARLWATLARLLRRLRLLDNAGIAAREAFQLNGSAPAAIREYLNGLASAGDYRAALAVTESLSASFAVDTSWLGAERARLLLASSIAEREAGLRLAERALHTQPWAIELHWLVSAYLALAGRWSEARDKWRWIHHHYHSHDQGHVREWAWSTFYLGLCGLESGESGLLLESQAAFTALCHIPGDAPLAWCGRRLVAALLEQPSNTPVGQPPLARALLPQEIDLLNHVHIVLIAEVLGLQRNAAALSRVRHCVQGITVAASQAWSELGAEHEAARCAGLARAAAGPAAATARLLDLMHKLRADERQEALGAAVQLQAFGYSLDEVQELQRVIRNYKSRRD